ncbi:MAG: hypothetical protein KJ675_07220 [Gammaproteobacteria bacterium]|nr:hypothetical protein [Gammaproteobacteria bacterium]MBU1960998.1 hypothetical protein [Gammaproteobacteria bacterium]
MGTLRKAVTATINTARRVTTTLTNTAKKAVTATTNTAKRVATTLTNTAKKAVTATTNTAKGVATTLTNTAKKTAVNFSKIVKSDLAQFAKSPIKSSAKLFGNIIGNNWISGSTDVAEVGLKVLGKSGNLVKAVPVVGTAAAVGSGVYSTIRDYQKETTQAGKQRVIAGGVADGAVAAGTMYVTGALATAAATAVGIAATPALLFGATAALGAYLIYEGIGGSDKVKAWGGNTLDSVKGIFGGNKPYSIITDGPKGIPSLTTATTILASNASIAWKDHTKLQTMGGNANLNTMRGGSNGLLAAA